MMMNYEETKEFKQDFKKLLKKFPSLAEDLDVNKQYRIELFHCKEIDSRSIFEIQGVGNTADLRFFKVKKFQCKSLKGRGANSGIRLVYAFYPAEQKIVFLEIYFKANQENQDRQKIINFLNKNKGVL
jgi:mRNA-degrading endonuclease RelE of RelBE toxin-antitoxin system